MLVKGEARAARLVREERDDYDSKWAATKGHLEPAGMIARAARRRRAR